MARSPRRRMVLLGSTLTLTAISIGGLHRRLGETRRAPTAPPHTASNPEPPEGIGLDSDARDLARAVRVRSEHVVDLERYAFEHLLTRPMQLAQGAVWRPLVRGDRLVGHTIATTRRHSLLAALGFRAGDGVLAIAGVSTARPARLLALASSFHAVDQVAVTVLRGERELQLRFYVT